MLELVIFAALAAVVLFQLYAVLGRRVGRQPADDQAKLGARAAADESKAPVEAEDTEGLTGLALLRARDPSFDVGHFLNGARGAYQMIVTAYAAGDRGTLKPLLAPSIYEAFDGGVTEREQSGAPMETVEFAHPPRADLETIDVDGGIARVIVRFLAEFRARSGMGEDAPADDRRTAEVWTFERPVGSANPNWLLARVDAAEA